MLQELPEIEIYRRQLNEQTRFKKIVDMEIHSPENINKDPETFKSEIIDELPVYIGRKGNYLTFTLGNGVYLVSQLGPSGRLYLAQKDEKVTTKGSIVLHFLDGRRLYFINLKSGWLHSYNKEEMDDKLSGLGQEPLDRDFTLERFTSILSEKQTKLRSLLVEQDFLAGIGKIYADEILFNGGVRPDREADDLRVGEMSTLRCSLVFILREAILKGGYRDKVFCKGDRQTGGYTSSLKVYNREGESCYLCSDQIKSIQIDGNKSYFCPTCQR